MSGIAGQIDGFLKSKGSPLVGLGQVFVAAGKKYGVDPRLVVGISGAESSFGKHLFGSNNAWGWGPGIPFGSWEEGISTVTRGLAHGYINQGLLTPAQIANKYAPASDGNNPSHWSGLVGQFMREMGAAPAATLSTQTVTPTVSGSISAPQGKQSPDVEALLAQLAEPSRSGLQNALMTNLGDIARYGHPTSSSLSNVLQGTMQDRATDELNQQLRGALQPAGGSPAPATPAAPTVPERAPGNEDLSKWVTLSPSADRKGVPTQTNVLQFVARIAQAAGSPLTIGTGSNHSQMTVNGNVSNHWAGEAADIPADGTELRRLGYLALLAAGMPDDQAKAAEKSGGLFNVGPWQVIFATSEGGNHYNHLHVGFRG